MSSCRSCGAPIIWATTATSRKMPLDAQPVDLDALDNVAGLFALRSWPERKAIAATPDQLPGEPLYRSHFATCPDAGSWRRR